MENNLNYEMYCTKQGHLMNNASQLDQKNTKQRGSSGRIQSAKSGIYRSGGKSQ